MVSFSFSWREGKENKFNSNFNHLKLFIGEDHEVEEWLEWNDLLLCEHKFKYRDHCTWPSSKDLPQYGVYNNGEDQAWDCVRWVDDNLIVLEVFTGIRSEDRKKCEDIVKSYTLKQSDI